MAKIAYLIGGTGAGKSHLAQQFSDRAHWIELDGIQFCAGRGLFPPNQPELTWKFQAWNIAFEYDDCHMAIRSAVDIIHGKC